MSWAILLSGLTLTCVLTGLLAPRLATVASAGSRRPGPAAGGTGPGRVALVSAGMLVATLVVLLAAGFLAGAVESWVDHPVFDFFGRHQSASLTPAMNLLTQLGNRKETRLVAVVAAVLLPLLWRRRRWLPPVLVLGTVVVQRYGQLVLAKTVDRGHPPTTLGTWPSGGCARLIAVYGTILLLVLVGLRQRRGRPVPAAVGTALWIGLAGSAWVEGFSRTYLLKHWVTDVVGGLAFGVLLLAVSGYVVRELGEPDEPERRPRARRAAGSTV